MQYLNKIKAYIRSKGIKQEKMAEMISISASAFKKNLAGETTMGVPTLLAISEKLKKPVGYWFEDKGNDTPLAHEAGNSYKSKKGNDMEKIIKILEKQLDEKEDEIKFLRKQLDRAQGLEGNDSGKEAV